jgi:enoyl-CoA hydratase
LGKPPRESDEAAKRAGMAYRDLLYGVDDRVATITLNRPRQLNAMNQNLVDELIEAIAAADADPEVRLVIVGGAGGKAFSSGYDVKESADRPKRSLAEWRARMQFATCFDMRYCSDDATFGAVEARFSNGLATMMLPWLIGQRCRALIYSGDMFDADEAFRLGLVDRVFRKDRLVAEVTKIAKRMSRVSLDCLKWNKRAINQAFEIMGLRNAIQYGSEATAIMDATSSPEAEQYDAIRRSQGLAAALRWRAEQFAPYE